MSNPVLKGASYILAHTPEMVLHHGTTQTTEMAVNPDSEYLKDFDKNLRSFEEAMAYPPNQVYIGNMTPDELAKIASPWVGKKNENADRFGKFGEIMPEKEFIMLMKLVDSFELVVLEENFTNEGKQALASHPILKDRVEEIKDGVSKEDIKQMVEEKGAAGIYYNKELVGYVKKAHDVDENLSAHVLFENLASKASGVLSAANLLYKYNIDAEEINYVIECSEEAIGDMNQRGGGNLAKSIAEQVGLVNATGSDTRSFCAAPSHALIEATAYVKAGIYEKVLVVAGGSTAKLGMNGKDHVKKGMPILEDVIGGFAVLITNEDDGKLPIFRSDIVGQHNVGTGSSPQAVMDSLVSKPLVRNNLKITDVDKFAPELQNPDVTVPAGAGNVPEANYKMIGALAVMQKQLEREQIAEFTEKHGMVGWAPTQGHIPSGVPYLGFALHDLTDGDLTRVQIIGKGSLFLGRMTNLFDGVSIILERNPGKLDKLASDDTEKVAFDRKRIGITTLGSEHGVEALVKGAELAASKDETIEVVLIGPKVDTHLQVVEAADEKEAHKKMEQLLDSGQLDGCVTMHYSFPIGVSTVGRVQTPSKGEEMLLATTTGTSATNRTEAMVRNAIYGIIAAKAIGKKAPTVGILNVDNANTVERTLKAIDKAGYPISFTESHRADGGVVMRGNDLLTGSADVMVTDTLTGNLLMKMFSAYTTGGSYESSGYGYGPGIGEDYSRLVLILSRASGVPVVSNAILYAGELAKGNVIEVAKEEFANLRKIGFAEILADLSGSQKVAAAQEEKTIEMPAKEVVTAEVAGIDIMDLDAAVEVMWAAGIYAESGMGCTGPVVLVSEANHEKAIGILVENNFVQED